MKGIRITNKITNKDCQSFKQYLNEISEIGMFTTEEENECAIKSSNGDREATNELIRRNLRFVVSVAKQYESANAPLEDLVNEGNIGLVMAAEKYNSSTGFKFITYAVFWIKKLILEYLAKNSRLVRLPSNKIHVLNKYNQSISEMEQKYGRSVGFCEVVDELSSSFEEDEIKDIENISTMHFESLDSYIGDDDTSGSSLYDIISNENIEATDHLIVDFDTKALVNRILNKLKPRDKEVMCMLFGLNGKTPMTLKEVSEQIGLTREMVRQIKEKSIKMLKNRYS